MDSIEINKIYKEEKKKNKEKRKLSLSSKNKGAKQNSSSGTKTQTKNKGTRKKKPTRGKLVKKLDTIFSQYIRLLGTDKYGHCECVTCGDIKHWKEMQNGHFISRSNYKYRRDEKNCHVQCMRCNVFLSGNYIRYTLFMQKLLGEKAVEVMVDNRELIKIKTPEIEAMIEHYSNCVQELKDEKNL